MSGSSVLLLTVPSSTSPAHSRRSSLSANLTMSVSVPGTPATANSGTGAGRSRGSLPGMRTRGGGLGGAEGLVVALGGMGDKGGPVMDLSVQGVNMSLSTLPDRPPALVLVPLEAHDTLTTPSALCFVPPMGSAWSSPDSKPAAPRRPRPVSSIELSGNAGAAAVERVVAHVKRVVHELRGTGIPVVAYTPSTAELPPQIRNAVESVGCSQILKPPFTPDSVQDALTKVHLWPNALPQMAKPFEPISRPRSSKPSLSLASLPAASTSYQPPGSSTSNMNSLPLLTPLVPPPPHLAARASYSCPHIYAPALPPCARRRSVDVGGLALALGAAGQGGGWGGWAGAEEELALDVPSAKAKGKAKAETPKNPIQCDAMYAELLSQMYTQTGAAVDGATSDSSNSPYPAGRPHSASDPHIPFAYSVDDPPQANGTPQAYTSPTPDPAHREHLISLLDRWEFEPHKLSDEDVLACAGLLFQAAFEIDGLQEDVRVTFDQIPPFLRAVRKIYRTQNQYHNFQHALDVFQAVYWFLCRAGVVPPVGILSVNRSGEGGKFVNAGLGLGHLTASGKWRRVKTQGRIGVLRNVDVFALLLAAVGHDVGHPGLSNAFMTNADTPLSRVFDHKSSLEQLHCALLLRLMHKYGMGHLLMTRPSPPAKTPSGGKSALVSYASSPGLNATYQQSSMEHGLRQPHGFRWLLVQTVLATDMSVHFDWIMRFKEYASSGSTGGFRSVPEDEERLMICQALIKCGDISNPTRPHAVSEHWSRVLLEEWACQATFEQELDLPVTVVNVDIANGAKQQAQGQVNFIDIFTQPLFNATADVIPQLSPITEQCATNRKLWQARMEALPQAHPPAPRARALSSNEAHYKSIFPLTLPSSLHHPTRPSSAGSTSTSLFSPTGSTSSVTTTAASAKETSAMRVAYKASVRKKKSFHHVSWNQTGSVPVPPLPSPRAGAGS
ncbi:3',5'-cyclic-nucleotide phosphodiesterase [Ceratobasidium sp. 423]|nr:3',5'-cyclic-nucleotide phosphodiesterase [Ceratobasidium sp. 423]